MPDEAPLEWTAAEDEDAFLPSNLFPEDTGLPTTAGVSAKGGARHDVRIKVNMAHGQRVDVDNMAVVAVRPQPRLLHGVLNSRDLKAVTDWIEMNRELIVNRWDGRASSVALGRGLQRLPA